MSPSKPSTRCGGRPSIKTFAEWQQAHRDFHLKLVRSAGEQIIQLIEMQPDRSKRYLRFYQLRDTRSFWSRDT